MRITITGIQFKYDNGFDQEYTGVELNFITQGFKFTVNEPVLVTKDQYEANKESKDGLKVLIVDKILSDVNGYIDDLNTFKEGLQII